MSTTPAGWRPDPYGRARQRFYDGTAWTDQIDDGSGPSTDPLGNSTVIPFTLPTTRRGEQPTPPAVAATVSRGWHWPRWLRRLFRRG